MDAADRLKNLRGRLRVVDVTDLAPELADAIGDGGRVRLREMTTALHDTYEAHRLRQRFERGKAVVELHLRGCRGLMLALTLCDSAGALLFGEAQADLLGELLPAAAADRLFDAAMDLNGLSRADEGDEKNASSRGVGSGSPTCSPGKPAANGLLTPAC